MSDKYCSNCGELIKGHYYKCLDNYMQIRFFNGDDESNCFCSKECFCDYLFLTEIEVGKDEDTTIFIPSV